MFDAGSRKRLQKEPGIKIKDKRTKIIEPKTKN